MIKYILSFILIAEAIIWLNFEGKQIIYFTIAITVVLLYLFQALNRLARQVKLVGMEKLAKERFKTDVRVVFDSGLSDDLKDDEVILLVQHEEGHYALRATFEKDFSILAGLDGYKWRNSIK